ncbi:hypothetical protein DIPPA_27414 [Diplonema papillatum]|nr:hypothetical protein DIPPA_27414 [Diplonema papillatum]
MSAVAKKTVLVEKPMNTVEAGGNTWVVKTGTPVSDADVEELAKRLNDLALKKTCGDTVEESAAKRALRSDRIALPVNEKKVELIKCEAARTVQPDPAAGSGNAARKEPAGSEDEDASKQPAPPAAEAGGEAEFTIADALSAAAERKKKVPAKKAREAPNPLPLHGGCAAAYLTPAVKQTDAWKALSITARDRFAAAVDKAIAAETQAEASALLDKAFRVSSKVSAEKLREAIPWLSCD